MTEWKIVSVILMTIVVSALSVAVEAIWWVDSFYMKISWTIAFIGFAGLIWFVLYSINKN